MATFEIDEYQGAAHDLGSAVDAYTAPITTQTPITTSASSQQTAVFNTNTGLVTFTANGGAVRVAIGANPTATATSKHLNNGQVWDVQIPEGQSYRAAVIDA